MICLSKRTVLFYCVLVVSLANVAGSNLARFDPISLLPTTRTCGIQNNDRIIGGERTDLDEHPWLALILATESGDTTGGSRQRCGGALLSERYVLTAAHCVHPNNVPSGFMVTQVALGDWDMTSTLDCVEGDCSLPPQVIPIEETIIHEGYNPDDMADDIALLRLDRNAQFNDFVKPICLPLSNELRQSSFNGEDLEISGWGATENANFSGVKLKARVPVMSISQCASLLQKESNIKITNKQICAGGVDGRAACNGDSGGPLMGRAPQNNNWIAVGIVSKGPANCVAESSHLPVIFTRVGAYIDWILSKLKP